MSNSSKAGSCVISEQKDKISPNFEQQLFPETVGHFPIHEYLKREKQSTLYTTG